VTKLIQRVGLGVLVAFLAHAAFAQDHARPPVKLIVPFPAGSAPDVMARLVSIKAAEQLGQAIVIDNRAGAGGALGAAVAARSASDGLTLFLGTAGTHGINSSLYKKLPYDPIKDFVPVVTLTSSANVLVARNDLGARTLPEFVAMAEHAPGKFAMGTGTNGTTTHLAGIMLNKAAGIEILHVPIKTTSMLELIAGRVDVAVETVVTALPFIRAGKVRALAVTSPVRISQLKDVPTVAESGHPTYSVLVWNAVFAPAGTPAAVVKQINEAMNKALQDPALNASLAETGSEVLGGTPEDLQERVKNEIARWPAIVKGSGASVD
jgi:tripartite-type tricarboxylate transporter receptor subunit TctC